MAGFDLELVKRVIDAAGDARITAAGGVRSAEDIGQLDRIGADAQVGMALYSGRMSLGEAIAAPLAKDVDGLWPTVVCDTRGVALGLVWSSRESIAAAVAERRGVYWSRSRQALWVKGETSGAIQELVRIDVDCDRDALKFVVRQRGPGFCHTGARGCWPSEFDLSVLESVVQQRAADADPRSGTSKLLTDPALLRSKLVEEAGELADAEERDAVVAEAADLVYMAMVALRRGGGSLDAVCRELERRDLRIGRRPMVAKAGRA